MECLSQLALLSPEDVLLLLAGHGTAHQSLQVIGCGCVWKGIQLEHGCLSEAVVGCLCEILYWERQSELRSQYQGRLSGKVQVWVCVGVHVLWLSMYDVLGV